MVFKKNGLAMSFSWIFSIIVGAVILFLALFIASNLISSGEYESDTKTAQAIVNTFDSMLTSLEQGKANELGLVKESKITTRCDLGGDFGENTLQVAEESGFGGKKWTKGGVPIHSINQNIFAEEEVIGKKLYFFVLPFEMPFKSADLMIFHAKQYCFVEPPEEVEDMIDNLANEERGNMNISDDVRECGDESIKVCFDNQVNCDVVVEGRSNDFEKGIVEKEGEEVYYVGNLIYPAIFSSVENYECGVERIMMRLETLSNIYLEKAKFVSTNDCNTGLREEVGQLKELAGGFEDLTDLNLIKMTADEIDEINQELTCQLY